MVTCNQRKGNTLRKEKKFKRQQFENMITKEREENNMLEARLQRKILDTIDEMALIQAYAYREPNIDRLDAARDDFFDQLNILRILLSLQIPDRKERNAVVDYIREGIFDREWRKYVEEVETGD